MIDDTSNLSTTAALRVDKISQKKISATRNILEMFGFGESVFFIDLFFGGCGIRVDVLRLPETNTERKSETGKLLADSGPFGIFSNPVGEILDFPFQWYPDLASMYGIFVVHSCKLL